jgi:hypothetical protein
VNNICAPFLGRVFGLGILSVSALACSGAVFKSAPDTDEPDTTDSVVVSGRGGASATGTGGKAAKTTGGTPNESEGGEATVEPQPQQLGGSHVGGSGGAISSNGGTAGAGGSVVPPEQGSAGEPNIPDPPLDPNCASPLTENWTAGLGESGSSWEWEFGDPSVDVANHRLVISYDDVAGRIEPYQGGYYVTAQVTLEGGTVLTPYPYSNEMRWPSVRRSSNGSGVELGAAKYGSSETWTTNDWPGFSGLTIANTHQVLISTYVKATAQAVAIKVSYGNSVYRSGWVSGFTWGKTNLGIMRYTGENNSRVYQGDSVYVGPLSGCQKLSDAAVEALFKN